MGGSVANSVSIYTAGGGRQTSHLNEVQPKDESSRSKQQTESSKAVSADERQDTASTTAGAKESTPTESSAAQSSNSISKETDTTKPALSKADRIALAKSRFLAQNHCVKEKKNLTQRHFWEGARRNLLLYGVCGDSEV